MWRSILLLFLFGAFSDSLFGQLKENFSDGNFTENPTWTGNTTDFVVNAAFQLQSNNTTANSSFYLSTSNTLAVNTQWDFWIKLEFNPSSANYVDAYLTASSSDLSASSTTGYFVRIGGTEDEVSLYKKQPNGTVTKIIDGVDGILNTSNNTLKVRVVRNNANLWMLSRDLSGTGNSYVSEGTVTDNSYNTSAYFGFLIRQSTASFFQKHYFDDIEIKEYVPDLTPPAIVSATTVSRNIVDVLFNEPLDAASASNPENYSANNSLGMPTTATPDASNSALVRLVFGKTFSNGLVYTLSVNGVKDVFGNELKNGSTTFSFYEAQRYDVVISEIFPDPNPQVGLPTTKFLELKNTTNVPINIQGWRLSDGGTGATLPAYVLQPGSFVIVCAVNSVNDYTKFGPVLGVSNFPSMNIGGATVVLTTNMGSVMHAVQYDLNSYKNEVKKDGGWTLEMVDTKSPCASNNWAVSVDPTGGTPGRKNSVDAITKDDVTPILIRAFTTENNKVSLVFNKTLDSSILATASNYTFSDGLSIQSISAEGPFFNKVNITLAQSLSTGKVYNVTVKGIQDCAGNTIGNNNTAKFGLAEIADVMEVVVNEILYNPLPGGVDYIELYNRSGKIIDLSKAFLANRNTAREVSSIQQISNTPYQLFPGEYVLLSSNSAAVKAQYITTNPDGFIQMGSFPSYPNTSGNVIVINNSGVIIDEVKYTDKWQFALVKNPQGVALERIDYNAPSVQSNFHSAASSVGYGTPGYKNSQTALSQELPGEITITPEVFSPDNDGQDDFLTIHYNFPQSGYIANITIFDATGRPVRFLQKNSLSGLKGYFRWDGLNDKGAKLPQGIYVVYTEIFNASGKTKKFKNTVVLARKYQ